MSKVSMLLVFHDGRNDLIEMDVVPLANHIMYYKKAWWMVTFVKYTPEEVTHNVVVELVPWKIAGEELAPPPRPERPVPPRAPQGGVALRIAMAPAIAEDSWLRQEEDYKWFLKGFDYASTQTRAIPGLSRNHPEETYFVVKSFFRSLGISPETLSTRMDEIERLAAVCDSLAVNEEFVEAPDTARIYKHLAKKMRQIITGGKVADPLPEDGT